MDLFSASLLAGKIRFGKYPTDEEATLLKESGYRIFVDLCPQEEITWCPYSREGLCYISLPIPDRTPDIKNLSFFRTLIEWLMQAIYAGYLVYIHCRGGHGRSGMFAGVLYGKIMQIRAPESLQAVHAAHQLRIEMKPKFRKMGSPQTAAQKRFVISELNSR
jgi:hypothetical protein